MSLVNKDIDTIWIQFLSIDDLRVLCQVNRYYNNLIRPLLQEYYDFYNIVDTIDMSFRVDNMIFFKAIRIGNLNVCKYLLNKFNYDIHRYDELAFTLSCEFGHLNVAMWLFSLGNVYVSAREDYALRLSCRNGHLDVVKWLYPFGVVNIYSDESAFLDSCKYGHLHVAEWLCTTRNKVQSCAALESCTKRSCFSIQVIDGKIIPDICYDIDYDYDIDCIAHY